MKNKKQEKNDSDDEVICILFHKFIITLIYSFFYFITAFVFHLSRAWNRINEYRKESRFFRIQIGFLRIQIIILFGLKQISKFKFKLVLVLEMCHFVLYNIYNTNITYITIYTLYV